MVMLMLFKTIIFLVVKEMFEMSPTQIPLRWVALTQEKMFGGLYALHSCNSNTHFIPKNPKNP